VLVAYTVIKEMADHCWEMKSMVQCGVQQQV